MDQKALYEEIGVRTGGGGYIRGVGGGRPGKKKIFWGEGKFCAFINFLKNNFFT